MKTRMVVLYDGIHNSVFQGQVLQPLVNYLDKHPQEQGVIVSFEKNKPSQQELHSLVPDTRITVIILPKLPFFGSLALRYAAHKLQPIVRRYWVPCHVNDQKRIVGGISSIVARGPLAAWIVGKVEMVYFIPFTIQARGLAAQEYRYTHKKCSRFTRWFHRIRAWQYEKIEQWIYGMYAFNRNAIIRTVSHSLKQYLIETFHAPFFKIKVEQADIPSHIPIQQRYVWRTAIRKQLGIPHNAYVYVYNGSAKPWQCPEQTIRFFAQTYQKNTHCFLLVLTQDSARFHALLSQYEIPKDAFHITLVAHAHIYRYLAAANAGILLREKHVVNWVSRPTKVLEYRAVGLKIIHNNTVGMLHTHK